jgi:hypothetical protein
MGLRVSLSLMVDAPCNTVTTCQNLNSESERKTHLAVEHQETRYRAMLIETLRLISVNPRDAKNESWLRSSNRRIRTRGHKIGVVSD